MIKTKSTDSPIVKRLKTQERAMLKLLGEYSDKLTRTVQIIYGLKAEVEWGRIIRFSTTSNFAMITGIGTVPKGEKIGENVLEQDYQMPLSMTLLLDMLDDDSTPYQLADAAQAIANVRQVLGPEEFHKFLKDETSDMNKIQALLPKLDTPEDREATHKQIKEGKTETPKAIPTPSTDLPGKLSGFGTDGLNDEQLESFKLSYYSNYMKVN